MSEDTPRAADIEALVEAFQASDCTELHVRFAGFELHLASEEPGGAPVIAERAAPQPPSAPPRTAGGAAPVPQTAVSAPSDAELKGYEIVRAPYLGVFYRAPKPGDPPYVELDQAVTADSDVCLVEVMKLFTAVRAGVAGTVARVLATDGAMVEAGQPLFAIAPAA